MAISPPSASRQKLISTTKGERIYAIGDIHGRYDLLRDLLRRIEAHSKALPEPKSFHVVLLGDLVDRGPDSAEILRYLYELDKTISGLIVLMGNHEEVMLRVYDGETLLLRPWLRIGGAETLRSFGLEPPHRDGDPVAFLEQMRRAIPRELMDWMRSLPVTARSGDYVFVHAGVRPGVALKRQTKTDMIWIREEFLQFRGEHGATIVHGHSISPSVDLQPNRIGIDTGAYRTGVLTALYLEGSKREIIATGEVQALDASAPAGPAHWDRSFRRSRG